MEIKKGDTVDIWVAENLTYFGYKVLYVPCATGDSWHLKGPDGELVYIQIFQSMELKKKCPVDLNGGGRCG